MGAGIDEAPRKGRVERAWVDARPGRRSGGFLEGGGGAWINPPNNQKPRLRVKGSSEMRQTPDIYRACCNMCAWLQM